MSSPPAQTQTPCWKLSGDGSGAKYQKVGNSNMSIVNVEDEMWQRENVWRVPYLTQTLNERFYFCSAAELEPVYQLPIAWGQLWLTCSSYLLFIHAVLAYDGAIAFSLACIIGNLADMQDKYFRNLSVLFKEHSDKLEKNNSVETEIKQWIRRPVIWNSFAK